METDHSSDRTKKPELRQLVPLINHHVLDRIKVDGQGVLVVESDASHFTYGRISILVGSGNLVGIVLRTSRQRLQDSVRQKSRHAGLQHETVRILRGSSHPNDRKKKPELRQRVPLYT
jgi:hypothetical protein